MQAQQKQRHMAWSRKDMERKQQKFQVDNVMTW